MSTPAARDDDRSTGSVRSAHATLARAGLVAVIALGVAIRLFAIGRAPINADTATVGLMAHEILAGHPSAFFWGQHYGGVEPYVVAAIFAIAGQSSFTLGLAPVVLDAIAALLVWRIGRRLLSPGVGAGAALLFWVWPEVYVQLSTIEWGFRWAALVCNLAALLAALRIVGRGRNQSSAAGLGNWLLFGAALGIGWWSTPEIAYYGVPALGMLAYHLARRRLGAPLGGIVAGALACAVGALPWLWDNVGHGFKSLHEERHGLAYDLAHLHVLVDHALPMLLGLQLRLSGAWVLGSPAGEVAYAVALAALAAVVVSLVVARRALVLVGFCVFAPVMFSIAPTEYWGDDRYAAYLAPVVCLLLVEGARQLVALLGRGRSPLWGANGSARAAVAVAVACGIVMSAVSVVQVAPFKPQPLVASESSWTTWHANATSWLDPVIDSLEIRHVSGLYAGYWVGSVVDFESDERITFTDVPFIRYRRFTESVEADRRTAWLFLLPGERAVALANATSDALDPGCIRDPRGCLPPSLLEQFLLAGHDPYSTVEVDGFLEVLPDRPVTVNALYAVWHRPGPRRETKGSSGVALRS